MKWYNKAKHIFEGDIKMNFEKYTQHYKSDEGMTLRVGKGAKEINFPLTVNDGKKYRLFTVGETEMFYLWKNEPDCPHQYRMITDALDTEHAIRDRFCLDLSCKKYEDYLKRVFKKIQWTPLMLSYIRVFDPPKDWSLGIMATAKKLTFGKGGFLHIRMDFI